jgi:hypothetical protein
MRIPGDIPGSLPVSGAFQGVSVPGTRRARETTAPPFSLRLTFEERARLEQEAGDQPIGAYIRGKLFDGKTTKPRRRHKRPVKDHQALGKLLGELGKARLANNLNQLARAVNSGSLPVTPDTEKALREACAEIQWLRKTLLEALGLKG